MKLFKVLKEIGVELSSYHGGSLSGKDIKKVMNNGAHNFNVLAVIMKEGKRPDSILSDANVDALCLHFWEEFILWDGAFSLARTVNPMENDTKTYLRYVSTAVHGNDSLHCTVTPKVHLILKHVAWQMRNIRGGWEIKWKIGWSDCIRLGCVCESAFAESRAWLSAHKHGRRRIPVHCIPM
jgi:hypothetical protein